MKTGNIGYWLNHFGYKWIGEKHPTHPIKKPYTYSQFTEQTALIEIKSLKEDGYVKRGTKNEINQSSNC